MAMGARISIKVDGEQTGGRYALFEYVAPPRFAGPAPHLHRNMEESLYVVSGSITTRLGPRTFEAGAGAFVLVPRGVPHAFSNPGSQPATLLWVYSPPGLEKYFDELVAAMPPGGGPPNMGAVRELLARYDIEPAELPDG
jgi:mannose-6-phosphate isomerase-like protein (cupin superfamily)